MDTKGLGTCLQWPASSGQALFPNSTFSHELINEVSVLMIHSPLYRAMNRGLSLQHRSHLGDIAHPNNSTSHCMYIPCLFHPFIHQWMRGYFHLLVTCCEKYCCEHRCTQISFKILQIWSLPFIFRSNYSWIGQAVQFSVSGLLVPCSIWLLKGGGEWAEEGVYEIFRQFERGRETPGRDTGLGTKTYLGIWTINWNNHRNVSVWAVSSWSDCKLLNFQYCFIRQHSH
jgi:hypothetical protein